MTDNSKILREKQAIQKKLLKTKNDLKEKQEKMDSIAGMLKHVLEAMTNPKSNKKAKR